MITDTEIKRQGIKALSDNLGLVETEKFIALLLREPFDYTKWQKNLFPDISPETLSKEAMKYRRKSRSN